MPTQTTRLITEGELARLSAGLSLEAVAKRVHKAPGTVRAAESQGACYGTARLLSLATGARMECYLRPIRIEVPNEIYLALKKAANESKPKPLQKSEQKRSRVTAQLRTNYRQERIARMVRAIAGQARHD